MMLSKQTPETTTDRPFKSLSKSCWWLPTWGYPLQTLVCAISTTKLPSIYIITPSIINVPVDTL